jgi:addiction module RelE/StbE family toxin
MSERFVRSYKKIVSKKPATAVLVLQKLLLFSQAPNHPSLALHKLKGNLKDVWAISIEYDLRILLDLTDKNEPLLVDIGTHDEVY